MNVDVQLYKKKSACRYIALTIGSRKAAQNEQVCAHQKSYRKKIFQNLFGAIMHEMDCSYAPLLRFFYVASDGPTTNRQMPDRIFGQFFTSLRKDSVVNYQWRSKALRGPGSTVTWGPSLSLPSTSPSLPFPSPFPPVPQRSPSPCRGAAPQIQLMGLGKRCKLP